VDSPYWRERSVAHRRGDVRVPALVIAGWYDVFAAASLRSFARSRDPRDRLIAGPWGHDRGLSHLVGEGSAGAAGSGEDVVARWTLDFYAAILDGRDPPPPRVRAYVLGARRWLELEDWPPPGGDEVLLGLEPGGAFTVDPDDPVPFLGGRALLNQVPGHGFGIRDHRRLLDRPDVLLAGRAAFAERTLLAGPVAARLAVEPGEGPPRRWAVTLCMEQPDGALHNLCEGIAEAPARAPAVEVPLGDVCAELEPGRRLACLVAGSAWPRWPRPADRGTRRLLPGSALALTRHREHGDR
jgi:predicted acyl esterase